METITRIISNPSIANFETVIKGFIEKGIKPEEIKPKENVFTYKAWKELRMQVKKGEHGVKVLTWITKENGDKFAKNSTVFHVSQVEAMKWKRQAGLLLA